jgi:hypothetical protein
MLKLSCSFDYVRFIVLKILTKWVLNCTFCVIFQFLTMFNPIVGVGSVGAGAASRYGSGSDQIMRLRLRNTVMSMLFKYSIELL